MPRTETCTSTFRARLRKRATFQPATRSIRSTWKSARLQLVAAAPPLGALYGAETGATLYAEVNGDTLTLTFCDVRFYQATELPLPDEVRVSARFRVRPR